MCRRRRCLVGLGRALARRCLKFGPRLPESGLIASQLINHGVLGPPRSNSVNLGQSCGQLRPDRVGFGQSRAKSGQCRPNLGVRPSCARAHAARSRDRSERSRPAADGRNGAALRVAVAASVVPAHGGERLRRRRWPRRQPLLEGPSACHRWPLLVPPRRRWRRPAAGGGAPQPPAGGRAATGGSRHCAAPRLRRRRTPRS